jgi:hypothetical protein
MLWTLENGIYYLVIQFLVWDLVSHMIIWKTVFIPSLILFCTTLQFLPRVHIWC